MGELMTFPSFNPQGQPTAFISSANKNKREQIATFIFDLTKRLGAIGPLAKPYLVLTATDNVNYSLYNFSLISSYQGFGIIRSASFTFRPTYFNGEDYGLNSGIATVENAPKCILFNPRTLSTCHIENDAVTTLNASTGSASGFYTSANMVVQGSMPFYADEQDSLELCVLNANPNNLYGYLHLNLHNYDVAPYYKTTFSSFAMIA
jgi:hypothetical protein